MFKLKLEFKLQQLQLVYCLFQFKLICQKSSTSKVGRASYSTNNQKGSVRIEGNKVKLPKVGWVKLCQHRPLEEGSIIKTVTILQDAVRKVLHQHSGGV